MRRARAFCCCSGRRREGAAGICWEIVEGIMGVWRKCNVFLIKCVCVECLCIYQMRGREGRDYYLQHQQQRP